MSRPEDGPYKIEFVGNTLDGTRIEKSDTLIDSYGELTDYLASILQFDWIIEVKISKADPRTGKPLNPAYGCLHEGSDVVGRCRRCGAEPVAI